MKVDPLRTLLDSCAAFLAARRTGRPYRVAGAVTFYEPNDEVRPVGAEIAEFEDAPPAAEPAEHDEPAEPRDDED
ncbi:MAG TPA: hypothetical protein VFR41_15755 [Acidimicrobiia bacterium]|nr:hypothetical protein [Acidimicrobiia bacterium]